MTVNGPCGYGIHRTLTKLGRDCMVVAPSMIPRKSGDRQKNDKRDAASLAVLHRGGLLTAVWVPDTAHEAMRDLIRTRLAAVRAVRTARQQLVRFCCVTSVSIPATGHPGQRRTGGGLPIRPFLSRRSRSCWRNVSRPCVWANNGAIVLMAICVSRSRPGRCSHWCRTCVRSVAWT